MHHHTILLAEQHKGLLVSLTHRNDHAPPFCKLLDQWLRNLLRRAGDNNLVKRCMLGPAEETITYFCDDIAIAQPGQRASHLGAQRFIDFDRVDRLHERREHGSLIAASGTDFQHAIGGLWLQFLRHIGHDKCP